MWSAYARCGHKPNAQRRTTVRFACLPLCAGLWRVCFVLRDVRYPACRRCRGTVEGATPTIAAMARRLNPRSCAASWSSGMSFRCGAIGSVLLLNKGYLPAIAPGSVDPIGAEQRAGARLGFVLRVNGERSAERWFERRIPRRDHAPARIVRGLWRWGRKIHIAVDPR